MTSLAATHLVSNPFDPQTSGPQLPVPHFLSPWTNNPHKIDPPGQMVPIRFGPRGQMVPNSPTACPPGQMEYSRDHLSRRTKLVWDHLSMGIEFLGTNSPWGLNWLGTVCPEGPINWGPDQMSRDHMRFGTNVSQPLHSCKFGTCGLFPNSKNAPVKDN